jgi:hypothetical protein
MQDLVTMAQEVAQRQQRDEAAREGILRDKGF